MKSKVAGMYQLWANRVEGGTQSLRAIGLDPWQVFRLEYSSGLLKELEPEYEKQQAELAEKEKLARQEALKMQSEIKAKEALEELKNKPKEVADENKEQARTNNKTRKSSKRKR